MCQSPLVPTSKRPMSFHRFHLSDPVCNAILLNTTLIRSSPPVWSSIFTLDRKAQTGSAGGKTFIAFLPSQTTGITTCTGMRLAPDKLPGREPKRQNGAIVSFKSTNRYGIASVALGNDVSSSRDYRCHHLMCLMCLGYALSWWDLSRSTSCDAVSQTPGNTIVESRTKTVDQRLGSGDLGLGRRGIFLSLSTRGQLQWQTGDRRDL